MSIYLGKKLLTGCSPSGGVEILANFSGNFNMAPSVYSNIVFNNLLKNIGGGYDTATGVFTAPADGLYTFSLMLTIDAAATETLNMMLSP